jgi:osmotically-inducible protein OsmY
VRSREIEEAVNLRLQHSSYLALRNVRCVCRNGAVVLRGCLPTHYLKQLLFQIVAEIAGGYTIENEIGVTGPGRPEPIGRAGRD